MGARDLYYATITVGREAARPGRFPWIVTELLISRSIMKLEFEWHDAKAEVNLQAHGVSFELAMTVFKDPFAIERLDDREDMARNALSSSVWRKGARCCLSPTRSAKTVFGLSQLEG